MENHKGSIHTGGQSEHGLESEGGVNEISTRNEHEVMSKFIAKKLAADLNIGYGDRTFVERLLFSSIKEMVRDLLQEYENVVADKIHGRIKNDIEYDFKVELESGVDYSYAAHAKLSTLMKEVKEVIETKKE